MIHTLGGATMSMNPVLRVNTLGLRYENEDIPNPYICNSRMRQPGNVVWAVFDSKWADEVKNTTPGFGRTVAVSDTTVKGVEDAVAKKNILKADTIEDLAKAMGVPADTFKATVDRYTELAKAGKDEDFGKSANNLWTVDKAPFYATKVAAVLLVTLGGFKVNDNLQVMDAEAKVIPGLYAAGNVAGDFYANDYPVLAAGLSHGRCITEGYLAGQNAAKEA
jgi:fumarate reductase flavoprotein subunit